MKYIKPLLLLLAVFFLVSPASSAVFHNNNYGRFGGIAQYNMAINQVFVTGNLNTVPANALIHTRTVGNVMRVEAIVTDPLTGEVVAETSKFCRNGNCINRVQIPYEGTFDVTVNAINYRGESITANVPNAFTVALPVVSMYGGRFNGYRYGGVTYLPNHTFVYGGTRYYSTGYPVYGAGTTHTNHVINRTALQNYMRNLRAAQSNCTTCAY
jgi:hypothetical protein